MKAQNFHLVEFEGEGFVSVQNGQSLLDASLFAGIKHLHVCGGKGKCSTCRVLIIEGHEHLSGPNAKERQLNETLLFLPDARLACQTSVLNGPVKLKRMIRDDSDIGLYTGQDAAQSLEQIGQELDMVLFFLDIRDYTTFAESHCAFDVIHVIRKLFVSFETII